MRLVSRPTLRWFALTLLAMASARAASAQGVGPPPAPTPGASGGAGADLADRVRRLEEMNLRLLEQYDAVLDREADRERRYEELETKYRSLLDRVDESVTPAAASVIPSARKPIPESESDPGEETFETPDAGRSYPDFAPGFEPPLLGRVGEGFELATPDEELSLGVRVLNQVDFKNFIPNDLDPAISGLYLPRTRFYFTGRLTRPIEYEVSVQRSVEGVIDLLDGFVNFNFNEGFQIKFGRSIVPYSFDWYDHLEPYFITPERSLFPLNFGLSRQAGLMAWGYLGEGRLEYAVGGFSGGSIGIADDNTTRDAVGYVNWRPFLTDERFPRLRYLNLGGSIAGGLTVRPEAERPIPLRTSIQSTENSREAAAASITFLDFEEDVRALGDRVQGTLHLAYYGGGWSIESEVQAGGFQYKKMGSPFQPRVPVIGYHVTAAYFLTGEEPPDRTLIVPLRPFDPLHGQYGPGAFEAFARISQIHLGEEVFAFDLADEDFWARDAYLTDVGFNWYVNRFVKFYVDWQHANFGSPVLVNIRDGDRSRHSDLFWIRCQIWF
ncbi:OprO/OprP family phosphate-selective porin [Tautonia plasticadhaerens]|uniref:Phosphate-selective porin O and P n=1 Tax=Tautonia plasticadhaerens TaxID=2527974 RepID=A0A518GZB2_9BACT|nr:porin [Tautonia plasticadhaerens]QDV33919.1 Phosphate-selective porin O and P [Tautonia plasticadhaerens]